MSWPLRAPQWNFENGSDVTGVLGEAFLTFVHGYEHVQGHDIDWVEGLCEQTPTTFVVLDAASS